MNNIKSPIIICGYPGGGTSYITKILRYSGMFAGVSANYSEFECYKAVFGQTCLKELDNIKSSRRNDSSLMVHDDVIDEANFRRLISFARNEEDIIKIGRHHPLIGAEPNVLAYNMGTNFIQNHYKDYKQINLEKNQTKLKNPEAIQFKMLGTINRTISPLETRKNHEHKMLQDLVNYLYSLTYNLSFGGYKDIDYNLITNLYQRTLIQPDLFKENIEYLKEGFDNIKDDFFDIFFNDTPKNQIWGFKYPLNSVVLPVLKVIFNDPKFLFISKEYKSNNNPKSKGGKNFQDSTEMDREIYTNPPWLDESYNYKIINFEEVLTDWTKMKDMLQWLSLGATTSTGDPKDFNENDFKKLLRITKFEPKKI